MNFSVLSLNVRYANPSDGPNAWEFRAPKVGRFLRDQKVELLAFQEVLPQQRIDLERMLPEYRSYGVSRDGRGQDEQCCWFVSGDWWFEEARTYWLSETPQQASKGWDAMLPRVCSLVRLRSAQGSFWAANVHLDHHGAQARRQGLELVLRSLPQDQPAILVGDLNQSDLVATIPGFQDWADTQVLANQQSLGTFHDFQGGTQGPRIDAILASPHWKLMDFQLFQDPELSDHYPLRASLQRVGANSA